MRIGSTTARTVYLRHNTFNVTNCVSNFERNAKGPSLYEFFWEHQVIDLIKRK